MVTIQIPDGYCLKHMVSGHIPQEHYQTIEAIPTNRVWWKFWLPKYVYSYTVLEKIPEPY